MKPRFYKLAISIALLCAFGCTPASTSTEETSEQLITASSTIRPAIQTRSATTLFQPTTTEPLPEETTTSTSKETTASSTAPKPPTSPSSQTIFSVDFETVSGPVTEDLFARLFGYEFDHLAANEALTIEDGYLKQAYTPYEKGSPRVSAPTKNLPGSDELYLTYDVFFEPGWEWVKGGKLPGLAGGTHPTGGKGADGTDGFSARLMWRPDGELTVYAYHPNRPTIYGVGYPISGRYEAGQWYRIVERVKINDKNVSNGEVEIWVDGEHRLLEKDILWRTSGDFNVDVFLYSSFYGGSTQDWAPSKTTYARFDNFTVTTGPPESFAR